KQEFKPDMLKIYPCMVLPGTKLYNLWKKGKFYPLTTNQATEIIAEFKRIIPRYMRIMRVQRDIPTKLTSAGVSHTNLRQFVHKLMKEKNITCNCIRCREPRNEIIKKINLNVQEYFASNNKEFFISMDSDSGKSILGFCRLRFPSTLLRKEITKDSALIRELHVYGNATGIGKTGNIQHKGFGKRLLQKAEQIAKKNKKDKMVIISGVGVRGYYRKLGYKKQGPYMVKRL
ncbi:MAG: GNAT family N-acetyltransferase, partial [Nanoarchaeota archaeon]|nr:GNAT family N-acetyltransferase [Nanoarchaeota archaeon]